LCSSGFILLRFFGPKTPASKGGRYKIEDGYLKVDATAAKLEVAEKRRKLFIEESGLRDGRSGGFAAGYAYYAEDGDFCEGGAGDEDAIGVRV
jgi:hypothetical protein